MYSCVKYSPRTLNSPFDLNHFVNGYPPLPVADVMRRAWALVRSMIQLLPNVAI